MFLIYFFQKHQKQQTLMQRKIKIFNKTIKQIIKTNQTNKVLLKLQIKKNLKIDKRIQVLKITNQRKQKRASKKNQKSNRIRIKKNKNLFKMSKNRKSQIRMKQKRLDKINNQKIKIARRRKNKSKRKKIERNSCNCIYKNKPPCLMFS